MSAYYVNFQFSHAYTRPFCPINYKRLQNVFNMVTNKDETETHNALCNFSKSPYICRSPGYMDRGIMRLVHFCPIYKWLAACACECGSLGCLYVLGLYGRWVRERARDCKRAWWLCVSVSVDVNIFVRHKCIYIIIIVWRLRVRVCVGVCSRLWCGVLFVGRLAKYDLDKTRVKFIC